MSKEQSLVAYKSSEEDDSDSTDYEPERKKCKLEEEKDFSGGSGDSKTDDFTESSSTSSSSLSSLTSTTDSNAENTPDTHTNPIHDSSDKPGVDLLDLGTCNEPITSLQDLQHANSLVNIALQRGQQNTPRYENVSSDSNTSSFLSDDMDPMEIPSDEYLSPPSPFPGRYRQRRNAIFQHRAPPPSALVVNEDDQFYQNEFEVASVSDINENPIEDANSTSGADDNALDDTIERRLSVNQIEETDANFADAEGDMVKSDEDTDATYQSSTKSKGLNSSDSELSDKDKWFCSQCNAKSQPYFRYCLRCFKIRRNWLPKRPVSRRLKSRKAAQRTVLNQSVTTRSSDASGEDTVDSRLVASSQSVTPSDANNETCSSSRHLPNAPPVNLNLGFTSANSAAERMSNKCPPEIVNSTLFSQSSTSTSAQSSTGSSQSQNSLSVSSSESQNLNECQPPTSNLKKADTNPVTNSSLCTICYLRDKDSAFVHNKIAHQYCCYTCADKILKKDGRCPICRGRVLRVVKIISV